MSWTDGPLLPRELKSRDVWAVYGIVWQCKLVYVGCTQNPAQRLATHRNVNFPHHDVRMVVLSTYDSKEEALADEKTLIFMLDPECNKGDSGPKMWDREVWLNQWRTRP